MYPVWHRKAPAPSFSFLCTDSAAFLLVEFLFQECQGKTKAMCCQLVQARKRDDWNAWSLNAPLFWPKPFTFLRFFYVFLRLLLDDFDDFDVRCVEMSRDGVDAQILIHPVPSMASAWMAWRISWWYGSLVNWRGWFGRNLSRKNRQFTCITSIDIYSTEMFGRKLLAENVNCERQTVAPNLPGPWCLAQQSGRLPHYSLGSEPFKQQFLHHFGDVKVVSVRLSATFSRFWIQSPSQQLWTGLIWHMRCTSMHWGLARCTCTSWSGVKWW